MTIRAARASAPSRVDLAGGTLDIWPISEMVTGALTINLAVGLRAHATVRPRRDRTVAVVSADRGRRTAWRLSRPTVPPRGPLSWLARLVEAFAPGTPLTLEVRAEAPAGAGLGGSSALGIAVGAALAAATGEKLSREALIRRVQNLETRHIRVPTGCQDYRAAVWGGLSAFHYGPDGVAREALAGAAALSGRLVLAYTGQPRGSGYSNWEMFRRYVDGERATVRRMEAIAGLARAFRDALLAADLDAAGRILGREGRLREGLAPSVSTPALRAAGRAARAAGALGVKICGAGGGGCLVAMAAQGRHRAVARAMAATGAVVLPVRPSRRGLEVSAP